MKKLLIAPASILVIALSSHADMVCTPSSHPFSRGYCSVVQCPGGQWSRGTAELTPDGTVILKQGLETDRADQGICGYVEFKIKDGSGNTVAYGYTKDDCIPGKGGGKARIVNKPPVTEKVSKEIMDKAASIDVYAVCSDGNFSPIGISLSKEDVVKAITIFVGSGK